MIYLVVGGSCSGKTSFVYNSWIKGADGEQKKDILPYYETEKAIVFGKWDVIERNKGTDRITRKDIPLFFDQIKKLVNSGKTIILEGDKITQRGLFDRIRKENLPCKLYLIKVDPKISIERNRKNGSTCKDSQLKAACTKAENIYYEYYSCFEGEVINTNAIKDFSTFSMTNYPKPGVKKNESFCVYILSHGRSDRVYTVPTLRKHGYTGPIKIVCDDEDDELEEYKSRYGNDVIVFHKPDYENRFDIGDNKGDNRVVVYARNAMNDIAKKEGTRHYVVLDDDYNSFEMRYIDKNSGKLLSKTVKNLDSVFQAYFDFLDESKATTVCMAQMGDFIGGANCKNIRDRLLRKAMNVWFCDTEKPFKFYGRINEDTTTYTLLGGMGKLFFTACDVAVNQIQTQANKGGLTDIYVEQGTWLKSFYTVMMCPSCCTVGMMGDKHKRIHHRIEWDLAVPKILNERYKKNG